MRMRAHVTIGVVTITLAIGCSVGPDDSRDGGPERDATADGWVGSDVGPTRADGGDAAGPVDDCTLRCLDALARCAGPGGSDTVDCARLCATYAALGTGCETERDALYDCAFGPPCGRCGLVDGPESDALVACIVARNPRPCFASCRAALAAGCAPGAHDPEDCNCVAQFYEAGDANPCQSEIDAFFTCDAEHPCDRAACEEQATVLNTCGLGCASGEVGCYVGPSGRCIDAVELLSDAENCGQCNNRCGPLGSCVGGACACSSGSHYCPGRGCVADTDASACGPSCGACIAPAHAISACDAGACGFACDPGYRAEGDLCVLDCAAGLHACGETCRDDDDPAACGSTCTFCPVPDHAAALCDVGTCSAACDAGYMRAGVNCVGDASLPCTATGACDPFDPASCGPGMTCRPGATGTECMPISATPVTEGGSCAAVTDCEEGTLCLDFGDGFQCHRTCRQGSTGACAPGYACGGTISGGGSCIRICRPLPERCNIYRQDCADPADACTLVTNAETGEQYTGCRPAGSRLHAETCGSGIGTCGRGMICVRDAGATAATCHWVCGDARGPTSCRDSSEWCGGYVSGWGVLYCLLP